MINSRCDGLPALIQETGCATSENYLALAEYRSPGETPWGEKDILLYAAIGIRYTAKNVLSHKEFAVVFWCITIKILSGTIITKSKYCKSRSTDNECENLILFIISHPITTILS